MKKPKMVPPVPASQQALINACLLKENFRSLLLKPKANRAKISKALDAEGITFASEDEKTLALDLIESVDWSKFKTLEELLGRSKLAPFMN